MAKTRTRKEEDVKKLTGKLSRSKSVVFTDYRGLKMSHLSDLRNKLAADESDFNITKNTLLSISLKQAGLPNLPREVEEGPTATLFSFRDEIAPIKTLVKALKDAQIGKVKGGILGDVFIDSFAVIRLSDLPTKTELRGKVVGTIAAPLYGLVNVLQGNLRDLVYALDQIRIRKGGE